MKLPLMKKKVDMTETGDTFKFMNYLLTIGNPATMDGCGPEFVTMCLEEGCTSQHPLTRFLSTSSSLRTTDIRRGAPNPEHLRIRDEWRIPQGDRELHYTWTGTTPFVVDADCISEPYEPGSSMESDHDDGDEPEGPMDDDELHDEAPMGPPHHNLHQFPLPVQDLQAHHK